MSISLSSIATAVASAFSVAEELEEAYVTIKPYVSEFMQAAETAYEGATGAGATKLAAVIAALQAVATAIGVAWTDGLQAALTQLVNVAKAAWNAMTAAVQAVA